MGTSVDTGTNNSAGQPGYYNGNTTVAVAGIIGTGLGLYVAYKRHSGIVGYLFCGFIGTVIATSAAASVFDKK